MIAFENPINNLGPSCEQPLEYLSDFESHLTCNHSSTQIGKQLDNFTMHKPAYHPW
jgi:hypothetical protein